MNILILANHFNAGGISNYVFNLAHGLKARGHKVIVGSSGGEWVGRLEERGLKHICLSLRTKSIISPKLFLAYFALKRIIKEEKIELIHSQTRVTSVLACRVSRKTGVPFISTCHGFFMPRWERLAFPCWGKMVIAISAAVREHLIRDFRVKLERIRLVHNGIDVNINLQPSTIDHRLSTQELKLSYGLKDGPVAGIIARLSEVKGHKYLIMAMKSVIEKIPDAQLLIVGEGKIQKELESLADKLGIGEKIRFIPAVSDTSGPLSAMDVFVMPSLQEGLGLSIMEAMLFGVPVAASEVGGIPSLVKDGITGILVKPEDSDGLALAIIDLLKNKEKASAMALAAKELIIREFSLEKMVEQTERVYFECLKD